MAQEVQPNIVDGMDDLNLGSEHRRGPRLVHRPNAVMYHVTNIRADKVKRYATLQTHIADDRTYDGLLVGLPVVCFTTTLRENDSGELDLPKESPYPRGVNQGGRYKRVKIPLDRYLDYDWWEMRLGRDQVHLLFTNGRWSTMLRKEVVRIPSVDKQRYEHLQYHGEGENAGWRLNVYQPGVSPFVNISVLDDVQLDGCEWDVVTRSGAHNGALVRFDSIFEEHERPNALYYCKVRWILEKVLNEEPAPYNSPKAELQFKVLRAAATIVEHRADFRVPNEMDHQQLSKFFRGIANLLKRAPAELLSSIYHVSYAKE